jgi:type II secretory pathway component PulF
MDEKKPARVAAVIFAVVAVLFAVELVVAERFVTVFQSANVELPGATAFLLEAADFLVNDWFVAAPAYLLFVVVGTFALRRVPRPLEGVMRLFILGLGIALVGIVVPCCIFIPIFKLHQALK